MLILSHNKICYLYFVAYIHIRQIHMPNYVFFTKIVNPSLIRPYGNTTLDDYGSRYSKDVECISLPFSRIAAKTPFNSSPCTCNDSIERAYENNHGMLLLHKVDFTPSIRRHFEINLYYFPHLRGGCALLLQNEKYG